MEYMRSLTPGERALLKAETAGEIVRWAGKPNAGRAFRSAFGIYAMAIPWCALTFSLFGVLIAAVLSGKPPARVVTMWDYGLMAGAIVFSGGFVAAGLAMLATPFWVRSMARRTLHAITDKRILSITTGRVRKASSIELAHIVRLVRSERRDGSGTLRIVTGYGRDSDGDVSETATELYQVRDVRAAERAVEFLRSEAASRASAQHDATRPGTRHGAA